MLTDGQSYDRKTWCLSPTTVGGAGIKMSAYKHILTLTGRNNQVEIWSSTWDHYVLMKNTKLGHKGALPGYVTWPTFEFLDHPNISGTAEDTTSNFACGLTARNTKPKKWKIGQKHGLCHVTYFSNFGPPPPNISATAEDINLKFCNCDYVKPQMQWSEECFSHFQSESPCKGAHGFTSQWSWQNDFCCFLRVIDI